jgi:hypothetical protein
MSKALGLIPSTAKKKKKMNERKEEIGTSSSRWM